MNRGFVARHSTPLLSGVILALLLLVGSTIWLDLNHQDSQNVSIISAQDLPLVTGLEAPKQPSVVEIAVASSSTDTRVGQLIKQPIAPAVSSSSSLFRYVQVVDGCGPHFEGECLNVRGGPSVEYPVVAQLRNGMVLKVEALIGGSGDAWYKVVFDEWLRYPERVKSDWYVAAAYVSELHDEGEVMLTADTPPAGEGKKIVVSRFKQLLTAYVGEEVFMEIDISTGLALTPTPRGTFTIFKKTPSRYMQGPLQYLASSKYYDLPGVPWNLYFTEAGAVIHGAYWHESFGSPYSHGCVNVPLDQARKLYHWADLGTPVIVQD